MNTADVGSDGSVDVTYKFDAIGRRVFRDNGTTATIYVQAGQQTIADYTASSAPSSPTYRYVYASYIDEPVLRFKPSGFGSLYYHRNQQYSVVALTNSSAAIVERYANSAYGVPTITNASGTLLPIGSVDNRYLYTGREWDQTLSLYHYRARKYDANLGRFASRDPIGYDSESLCMYQMVDGHPVDYTDPYGMRGGPSKMGQCGGKSYVPQTQDCCDGKRIFDKIRIKKNPPGRPGGENIRQCCKGDGLGTIVDCDSDPSPCDLYPREQFCHRMSCGGFYKATDPYTERAKTVCKRFLLLYGGSTESRCVANCLATEERTTQLLFTCDERNRERLLDHVYCYAKCHFVPYLGPPEDGVEVGVGILLPDIFPEPYNWQPGTSPYVW